MLVFVGIDWSEKQDDICIVDQEGEILAKGRASEGIEGIARLHEMVAEHVEEPEDAIVGIETDRGLGRGASRRGLPGVRDKPLVGRPLPRPSLDLGRSQTPVTPRSWPTSCARTATTTAL